MKQRAKRRNFFKGYVIVRDEVSERFVKQHFNAVLFEVAKGRIITITRGSEKLAVMVSHKYYHELLGSASKRLPGAVDVLVDAGHTREEAERLIDETDK